jgi:hypothetical protein
MFKTLGPGVCKKHYGFVIYGKLTDFVVSFCLFSCQSQAHLLGQTH